MTQTVDSVTGEIDTSYEDMHGQPVTQTQTQALVQAMRGDQSLLPIHMQFLELDKGKGAKYNADRLAMLSSYESGPKASVEDFLGKRVNVLGACLHGHGEYTAQKDDPARGIVAGQIAPGYVNLFIKTDIMREVEIQVGKKIETVKRNLIIVTSASMVMDLFKGLIFNFGWFDWGMSFPVTLGGNRADGYTAFVELDSVS